MFVGESSSANLYTVELGNLSGCFFSSSLRMTSRVLSSMDLVFSMTKAAIQACFSSPFSALRMILCMSLWQISKLQRIPSSSSRSPMLISLMRNFSLYLSSPAACCPAAAELPAADWLGRRTIWLQTMSSPSHSTTYRSFNFFLSVPTLSFPS